MRTPLAMQTHTDKTDAAGAPICVGDTVLLSGDDTLYKVCRFRDKLYITPLSGHPARVTPFENVQGCVFLNPKGRAA